jgi:lipopolysaccharide export system permease protein
MILHLYFARRFLTAFLGLALLLFFFIALVDAIDLMRDFSELDVSFGQVLSLVMLKSPSTLNQILPLITLLATITLFVNLARTSELVVTRAAGRSAIRSMMSPVVAALVIGVLAVTMFGPIVATFSNRFQSLSESYRTGGNATLSVSSEGLWLRQGTQEGQTVIRATRSSADAAVLYDVSFLSYGAGGGPVRRIEAESAALSDGEWTLHAAKDWPLTAGGNPEAEARKHDVLTLPSSLTIEQIRDSLGATTGVSIWEMSEFIAQLENAGFSSRRQQVWLQSEIARPLFLMSMVLVGSAFTMRHTRFGGTGPAVMAAILLGFALYFARSFATILGENGQLAVPLAAWAVPVAGSLLAIGLILNVEDG